VNVMPRVVLLWILNIFIYVKLEIIRFEYSKKRKKKFFRLWGNNKKKEPFYYPLSVYNDEEEDMIYVGDSQSVQLWRKEESYQKEDSFVCIQRLGGNKLGPNLNEFNDVFSICRSDDCLYISDKCNTRIQIFKAKTD